MANKNPGLSASWSDIWLLAGVRTPFADYNGPLAAVSPPVAVTPARELKKAQRRYGIASACIGGGQGIALLIENLEAATTRSIRNS